MFQFVKLIALLLIVNLTKALPLEPRAGKTIEAPLYYKDHWWYIEVGVGSNNQTIRTVLDTGSSDVWFMSQSNPYCDNSDSKTNKSSNVSDASLMKKRHQIEDVELYDSPRLVKRTSEYREDYDKYFNGEKIGNLTSLGLPIEDKFKCPYYFDAESSSSFHSNDTEFMIIYVNSQYAYGSFATDTFTLGETKVDDVQFAVANEANISTPIFGIGAIDNEIVASKNKSNFSYPNFPRRLYESGEISNYMYLISVNSSETVGSILFGGSDSSKYNGDLVALDIMPSPDGRIQDFNVNVSVSYANTSNPNEVYLARNVTALVDIGSSDLTLSPNAYKLFLGQFSNLSTSSSSSDGSSSTQASDDSEKIFPCEALNNSVIVIHFGTLRVQYPLAQWAEPVQNGYCQISSYMNFHTDGDEDDDSITLGLPVYDRVYTVFDLETSKISFAEAKEESVGKLNVASSVSLGTASSTASASTTVPAPSGSGTGSGGSSAKASSSANDNNFNNPFFSTYSRKIALLMSIVFIFGLMDPFF